MVTFAKSTSWKVLPTEEAPGGSPIPVPITPGGGVALVDHPWGAIALVDLPGVERGQRVVHADVAQ
eukprot:3121007-Prymnesium_polylepis.1